MKTNVVPIAPQFSGAMMSFNDMRSLAESVAKSGLFGIKTADQALTLMSIAQAEGRHPALAARDYHIIQNTPAKKSEAMLRDFLTSGGKVEWHELNDDAAEATFSHPSGGSIRLRWDKDRVKKAGINNPMHNKYPRQMLRSRLISEGVRTVCPMATSGLYVPEEVAEFAREPIDITPPAEPTHGIVAPDNVLAALRAQGDQAADGGVEGFTRWWNSREIKPRRNDLRSFLADWQIMARAADERGGPAPEDIADTITTGLAAAQTPAEVDDLFAQHATALNELPHDAWVPLQAAIDGRRAELENAGA